MFDFTISVKQGLLNQKGYCSLCGIAKADTTIGNRKVCSSCKAIWDVTPAPPMLRVVFAEKKAVVAHEAKFGELRRK